MNDWHEEVVEMRLGNQADDLIAELAEVYPDGELRTLIRRAAQGRVGRPLLTASGLYAVRYLAAVIMSRARAELGTADRDQDDAHSPQATPQGAIQVILKAIRDRIGSQPGTWLNSYALIGQRLAGELYQRYFTGESSRLYRPRPTGEQLADGTGGDDALRIICEAGGREVLAPRLQDDADANAALLAFLDDEAGKNGCRRVDVLAAVVRVMRSFVRHGWSVDGRPQEQVRSWTCFSEAVGANIGQRSKAAC
jgi:hypothetical protein